MATLAVIPSPTKIHKERRRIHMPIVDLSNFAEGGVAERINIELQKVLENIADPNTDPKKVRKVQLTLSLKSNEKRELVSVSIQAKPTLAPAKDLETEIIIGRDDDGRVTGAELKSGIQGQTYFENGEIKDDVGHPVADNVVDYTPKRSAK